MVAATMLQPTATAFHLFVANSKEEAAYRFNDLEGLLSGRPVYFFPDSFKRPAYFDDLNPTHVLQRSEVINKITTPAVPGDPEWNPCNPLATNNRPEVQVATADSGTQLHGIADGQPALSRLSRCPDIGHT